MPLTPDEKAHLKALIDADAPLPPGFRARLFPQPPGVELIWPGKGATSTDPVADRPELRVVDRYSAAGDGWRDTLIHGDNAAVLRALSHGPHREAIDAAGGLRLIYLDPPFLTGRAFAAEAPVGVTLPGEPVRTIRLPAYRDEKTGGLATYLDAMLVRLRLMHDLLADDGSLYLHCDHRLSAAMRLLLDEVFGPDRLVNEIVWQYGLGNPGGRRAFARKHDTILLYGKTDRYRFNRLRGEITPAMAGKYRHEDESGRYLISYGKKYYLQGGKPLDTVWAIPTLGATDTERLGYPTQKPEALLERILLASSDPGDLVADFCCGSGTLPAVAGRLGRRWLAADAGLRAIQTTRTRLLRGGAERFDLVALDGPTTAPLSTEPAAILSASVVVMAGTIRVRLTGYDVSASDHRDPAIRTWSDWIETWAVAIEHPATSAIPRPFTPVWWAVRSGRGRALALASDPIPAPDPHTRRVTVKIVDVLGRETWAIIPVDDPSSEIQQSGPAPTNAASNVSSTPRSIRTIVPVPSSAPNDGDAT